VAYLFEKRGVATFEAAAVDLDALMEAALDAGANDVVEAGSSVEVVTAPGALDSVVQTLTEKGFAPAESSITMEASTTVNLEGSHAETMLRVADALEDLDDVQNVYANFDISDEEMQRIAG
jgi:transcriptional/translational regulatory protein YebC/TACO1